MIRDEIVSECFISKPAYANFNTALCYIVEREGAFDSNIATI